MENLYRALADYGFLNTIYSYLHYASSFLLFIVNKKFKIITIFNHYLHIAILRYTNESYHFLIDGQSQIATGGMKPMTEIIDGISV